MKSLNSISVVALLFAIISIACNEPTGPVSTSGVSKATVKVPTDPSGHTVEQQNIMRRLLVDNAPGSIKHLYIISAYSGQVILYSTVQGKVTSGSKRLSPSAIGSSYQANTCNAVDVGGVYYCTSEVLGDDGVYGSSGDYIFWFDSKDAFHQHFNSGGQIVHISDKPIAVKNVIMNIESPDSVNETKDEPKAKGK